MAQNRGRWTSVHTLAATSGSGTSSGLHLLLGAGIFLILALIWIWAIPKYHLTKRATPHLDRIVQISGGIVFGAFSLICLIAGLIHLF
jgi:hypothetical protein